MKSFITMTSLVLLGFASTALSVDPKCHRHIAAHLRNDNSELKIERIGYERAYRAKTLLTQYSRNPISFDYSGHLYTVESSYYSGTSVDLFLVDNRCQVLEKVNLYSE